MDLLAAACSYWTAGGTKGFETLGVLKEIETMLGGPLYRHFRLIYGTSTGACTAAFLALGARVDDIAVFYRQHIPPVLRERTPAAKAAAGRAAWASYAAG